MKRIEQRLRDAIGLDASSIGSTLIERTVRLRMKEQGLKTVEEYLRLIESSAEEWNELMESVVVTETWFFRDRGPFAALVRVARDPAAAGLTAHPTRALRLLSVPCSSGEEPYSQVMALADSGIPTNRFSVDAADISPRVLARARQGLYGKNSFRGKDLAYRKRHFQATSEGFVLSPAIRNRVHFYEANLFSDDFLGGKAKYDIIFCRNLLIYFDRGTQQRAVEKLNRLLAPSGVLFVGAAELPLVLNQGFVPVNLPQAFACVRAEDVRQPAARPAPHAIKELPPQPLEETRLPSPTPAAMPLTDSELERARTLADAGHLQEAAAICEAHLRDHGPSAEAYYLLGLVRDASGDGGAIDCYRKALYLEPDHYETLAQMAAWSQKQGDAERAQTFRERARRVKSKTQHEAVASGTTGNR